MSEKLDMKSMDITQDNIAKIKALFPSAVTEVMGDDGKVKLAIDFDALKQELWEDLISEKAERYQMTWPDKSKAKVLANSRITATLRPVREKSVDFDNTENLYIEGDNLDVLKLLRETYLGKVKMIYIDPPYNTGNDFVYEDDFAMSTEDYAEVSGQYDDQGNRLFANTESNGRFHTDWLNMIYPRLKIARDLLSDDGVIFISIDDNEVSNLINNCNEIFGTKNFLGIITWSKKRKGSFLTKKLISLTEYCLVYAKNSDSASLYGGKAEESESQPIIKRTNPLGKLKFNANTVKTKLDDGILRAGQYGDESNPVILENDIAIRDGVIITDFTLSAHFVWSQEFLNSELKKGGSIVINTKNLQPRAFRVYGDDNFKGFGSFVNGVTINGTNEDAYEELDRIFGFKKLFDYSKPRNYIKEFIKAGTNFDKDAIILDFFSGSATTAHAVMQFNAEDGGNRRFIMVQLPERCDEKSEAYKLGYKTICDIGEERIRRAGKKIQEENGMTASHLDIGFRVLKLDSSNMQEVYYNPSAMTQDILAMTVDNVKADRTPLDLLFQVMLDLGVELSAKIEEHTVSGKTYYAVNDNDIIACFDDDIDNDVITAIAKQNPLYAVFKDKSFATDSVGINNEQLFKTYSPSTVVKVI